PLHINVLLFTELEDVPSLSGRKERSHEHKFSLFELFGTTNKPSGNVEYLPYFDKTTETRVTVQASRTVHLHCRVRHLGNGKVSWIRKSDLQILSIGTIIYTTDQRFSVIHENNTDDWTMRLLDSRESDSGNYECQVSTEPKLSLDVQLSIIVVKAFISEGPALQVISGSSVNLTCRVQDKMGTLFLFWYLNESVLSHHEMEIRGIKIYKELGTCSISRLFIAEAKHSDAGNYACKPSYTVPSYITLQVVDGKQNSHF
ncbi:uncharacterized protein NPIL_143031, partial [Nephila pilipes]